MYGRMIHKLSGELDSQLYDRDGQVRKLLDNHICLNDPPPCFSLQCINSIDRDLLNQGLLEEADASPNVRVFFNHKAVAADFDNKSMTVRDATSNSEFTTNFDLCIGADGSYSVIRRQMMRVVR